jgi:hypothetical protein
MSVIKLAEKFAFKYSKQIRKEAASKAFDILGLTPRLKEIEAIVKDKGLSAGQACEWAQFKFNKLVVPYLNMKPVNNVATTDLEFFLHDLIHEAIKPGSIDYFKKQDDDKSIPTHEKYNIQDYIDEDIAEVFSNGQLAQGIAAYFANFEYKINDKALTSMDDLVKVIKEFVARDALSVANSKQRKAFEEISKVIISKFSRDSAINSELNKVIKSSNRFGYSVVFGMIGRVAIQVIERQLKFRQDPIIENERVASLLRRWLMQMKTELQALKVEEEVYGDD